jgi:hypothetical protein
VENVYDDDCFKEAGLSHQFPMFSTSIDNQLASKAKKTLLRIGRRRDLEVLIRRKEVKLLARGHFKVILCS